MIQNENWKILEDLIFNDTTKYYFGITDEGCQSVFKRWIYIGHLKGCNYTRTWIKINALLRNSGKIDNNSSIKEMKIITNSISWDCTYCDENDK